MEDVTQTVQITPKPSKETRIKEAMAKGKEAAGAAPTDMPAPEAKPKEEATNGGAAGETTDTDGQAAPSGKDGEPSDGAGEAAEGTEPATADGKPADSKPEPKTKRGKEWGHIERAKAEIAKRERETARREQQNVAERAELQRIGQTYQELDRMFREDPAALLDRLKGRPGGLRDLLERAVAQEKQTPEEQRAMSLEAKLAAIEEKLSKRETAEEEAARKWREQQEAKQTDDWHRENLAKASATIRDLIKEGGYPNVARQSLKFTTREVYERILRKWDGGRGEERPIYAVLDDVEAELAQEAGQAPDKTAPPARANGAEPTAKPEAKTKRAPPTLTSAQATAKSSGAKELKGKARLEFFADRLKRA